LRRVAFVVKRTSAPTISNPHFAGVDEALLRDGTTRCGERAGRRRTAELHSSE
jgi:hypothetical protein